jgi:negative regulator of flagellin synthesis FlgM
MGTLGPGPENDKYGTTETLMKIPPTSSGVQGTSTGATDSTRTKPAGSTAASPSAGSDSVQISSLSTHLQSIQSGLSGPEFDRAKVEKIKQAIADGTLTVNSSVVADKILSSVHEFLFKGAK